MTGGVMFHFSAVRRVLYLSGILISVIFSGTGLAALDDLEGSQGHAPSTPSILEGAAQNLGGGQPLDDGIVCAPGTVCTETATRLP